VWQRCDVPFPHEPTRRRAAAKRLAPFGPPKGRQPALLVAPCRCEPRSCRGFQGCWPHGTRAHASFLVAQSIGRGQTTSRPRKTHRLGGEPRLLSAGEKSFVDFHPTWRFAAFSPSRKKGVLASARRTHQLECELVMARAQPVNLDVGDRRGFYHAAETRLQRAFVAMTVLPVKNMNSTGNPAHSPPMEDALRACQPVEKLSMRSTVAGTLRVPFVGGADSSAIGVPKGTGGVLKNSGIAANSRPFSKGLFRLRRPDSGAIGATRLSS
jgi:hypothetical protein